MSRSEQRDDNVDNEPGLAGRLLGLLEGLSASDRTALERLASLDRTFGERPSTEAPRPSSEG